MSPEDRFAIEQQVYRYAYAWDSGDLKEFLSVFTDDAIAEGVMVGADEAFSRIEGHIGIQAFFEAGHADASSPPVHHTGGVLFDELTSDGARTRSMVVMTRQEVEGPVVGTHGVYHDRWQRGPDGWQIAHRRYVAHGYRQQVAAAVPSSDA